MDFDFHYMSMSGPIIEIRFELLESILGSLRLARDLAVSASGLIMCT